MLPVCNLGDAGNVARSYTGGGMTDWSLASENELKALYTYSGRAGVGGFNAGTYWSSSQYSGGYPCVELLNGGGVSGRTTASAFGVRPVRAF